MYFVWQNYTGKQLFSPVEHGETWRVMCDARHFLAKVVQVCGLHPLFPLLWISLRFCTAYLKPPVVYVKMPQTPHVQPGICGFPSAMLVLCSSSQWMVQPSIHSPYLLFLTLSIQSTINSCTFYLLNVFISPTFPIFIATTLVQAINIFHMDYCDCLHSTFFFLAARVDLFKTTSPLVTPLAKTLNGFPLLLG